MYKKQYQSPEMNIEQLLIEHSILASAADPLNEDKGSWDAEW